MVLKMLEKVRKKTNRNKLRRKYYWMEITIKGIRKKYTVLEINYQNEKKVLGESQFYRKIIAF